MSLHDVVIRFLVTGMPDVSRAFQTIEQAATAANRANAALINKGLGLRPINAPSAQTDRDAARASAASLAEEYRRSEGRGSSMRHPSYRMPYPRTRPQAVVEGPPEPTLAQRAASLEGPPEPTHAQRKAADRDATKEAKAKVQAMLAADREVARIRDKAQRLAEKHAKEDERRAEQAGKAESRAAERAAREKAKIRERENAEIVRDVQRLEREQLRAAQTKAKEQKRDRESFARGLGNVGSTIVGGAAAGVGRVAGVASNLVTMATTLGGGFSLTDSVANEQKSRKKAAELSASTLMSGGPEIGTEEILGKAKAIGISQNMDPSQVMEGFDAIKKLTGDLPKAMEMMPDVAKLATATGSNVGHVSELAGNILAANPNISNEDMQQQLRMFTKAGVVGGVEIQDFAKYGSRITAGAGLFGGNREQNEATLGALAQVARQRGGAASAAEATMGAQRFATDVQKHAADLEANGIKVSDGKGTLRSAQEITLDMLKKTGGDVTKLADLGLGDRGVKPLTGFADIYREAGGGKKGEDAVTAEFKKYTDGVSKSEIDAAAKRVLAEQEVEIEMRKLSMEVGQSLLPILRELTPALKDAAPILADVVKQAVPPFIELIKTAEEFATAHKGIIEGIAAHPIGAIMALEVGNSIKDVALGDVIKNILLKLGGGGAPPPVPGGGPGGGGGAAEGGMVLGGMAGQAYSAYDLVSRSTSAIGEGHYEGKILGNLMREGTDEQKAVAKQKIDEAKELAGAGDRATAIGDLATRGANALLNPFAAIGNYVGDKASEALGYQSGSAKTMQTLKAAELVDTAEVQSTMTAAFSKGIEEAAKKLSVALGGALDGNKPFTPPDAAGTGIVQRTRAQ